mgnify:CR=1 FL=1
MQWETVIGLEIHTQLATQSKIFSGAPTAFGAEPNTQVDGAGLGRCFKLERNFFIIFLKSFIDSFDNISSFLHFYMLPVNKQF